MTQLQGLFVDFYGTVVGGDRAAVEGVCQRVINDHQITLTAPEVARRWGLAYFAAIEALNGSRFRTLLEIETDTLVQTVEPLIGSFEPEPYIDQLNAYLRQPPLFEEVRSVVENTAVHICVVSNADEAELTAALAHHELRFDYIMTSEKARAYKPMVHIFEAALEMTGWDRDRVIHIGDSLHSDVAGAHAANIRAAWVCRKDRIGDIGTDEPDWVWSNLEPILELV
jgi:2-haloacid dehalogenase/putative hydrolase of the HAD superfamily